MYIEIVFSREFFVIFLGNSVFVGVAWWWYGDRIRSVHRIPVPTVPVYSVAEPVHSRPAPGISFTGSGSSSGSYKNVGFQPLTFFINNVPSS